jgi:hypothetical protein
MYQVPRRNLYKKRDILFDFAATCFLGYNVLVRTTEGVNVSTVSISANIQTVLSFLPCSFKHFRNNKMLAASYR